jgi:hypothetical protein
MVDMGQTLQMETIWHIGLYIEKLKNEVIYTMSRLIDKWNIKLNEKLVTILCLIKLVVLDEALWK